MSSQRTSACDLSLEEPQNYGYMSGLDASYRAGPEYLLRGSSRYEA